MKLWTLLLLLSAGCGLLDPSLQGGSAPTPEQEAAGVLVDSVLGPLGGAGVGGSIVALLGGVGAFFSERRKSSRKRKDQWDAINRLSERVLDISKKMENNSQS